MPRIKRKWDRLNVADRSICNTPGCEDAGTARCRKCNQAVCKEHKGAHSALHTFLAQRAASR